jgi:hypothetical protein
MPLEVKDFRGRVTFITGPEKDCGKTTLLNACLALLRGAGEGGLAFMGVGFDGEARDALSGLRKPRIEARAGEVFVTAEAYLRATRCLPEVLDVLPGSTALGRLAIARAGRAGAVTIVGPERNDYAAWAISRIREEAWAGTVLVDGAINRITQVAAFGGARFMFSLRASPADLERQARRVRHVAALQRLPSLSGLAAGPVEPVFELEGPLTQESAGRIPAGTATVVVEDFTKVFLDGQGLGAFLRDRALVLREKADFGGFIVVLRDLSREAFRKALADEEAFRLVGFNPYEASAGADALGGAA